MERINPYAVMRNTATLEAYRAYTREATKAGAPFFVMATVLLPLWISFQGLLEPRVVHAHVLGLPLFAAWMFGPAALCLLFTVLGALRVRKYRREHPIPEAWRQAPRRQAPRA